MNRKSSETNSEKLRKSDHGPAIYFSSLALENVRCFGPRQTLNLSDGEGRPAQWTIILGNNGVGKTTLLQSLAALLPVEDPDYWSNGGETDAVPRYVRHSRLYSEWTPCRYDWIDQGPFDVSGAFFTGPKLTERTTGNEIGGFQLLGGYASGTAGYSAQARWDQIVNVACFGYGAARRMGETSLSDVDEYDSVASLFSEHVALVNAEELLLQADYAASKPSPIQEQAQKRRDQIKKVLLKILPDVDDIRFTQLSEIQMKPGIEVKTPYGWGSVKDLSLGYKTLIAWMVDMASRLFERYPGSPNPLAEPAIVLVDEIDLHLHPKWQRILMSYLTELFPNTQFIATAHSPLVVQAATNANIVVLRREGNHVVIDNDIEAIRGWRIDQVLTSDLFGLESARPPKLDALLSERKGILSKGKFSQKDKKRLRALEAKIGPLPAGETQDDIEAMDIIRRAAKRLSHQ